VLKNIIRSNYPRCCGINFVIASNAVDMLIEWTGEVCIDTPIMFDSSSSQEFANVDKPKSIIYTIALLTCVYVTSADEGSHSQTLLRGYNMEIAKHR